MTPSKKNRPSKKKTSSNKEEKPPLIGETVRAFPVKAGAVIFLCALAIRLLFLWDISDAPTFDVPVVDSFVYHEAAASLAKGEGFQSSFFFQPFLYPAFLSVIYSLLGVSVIVAKLVQALLGALTCLLVWHLGRKVFGNATGIIAGLIVALYGPLLFFESELLATGLASLGMVVLVLLFMAARTSESMIRFFVLGLCCALCTITRPTFLLVALAGMVWLLVVRRGSKPMRVGLLPLFGIALLGFLIPASIVAFITREHTGHLTFLPSSGGINFYLGNNENYAETVNARMGSDWSELLRLPELENVEDDDQSRNRFFQQRTMDYATSQPGAFLAGMGRKTLQIVSGREIPRNVDVYLFTSWSWMLRSLLWKIGGFGFPFGLLFPFAVLGCFLFFRKIPVPIWLSLVIYGLSVVAVFVTARYRIPLVPLLSVLAAAGITGLLQMVRRREMKRIGLSGALLAVAILISSIPGPFVAERMDYEPELYCCIGDSLRRSGKPDEALQQFEEAVRLAPDHAEAQADLAQLYAAGGRIDEAIEACRAALKSKPNMLRALSNLSSLLSDKGDHEEAIEVCRKGLEIRPRDPALLFNMAKALAGRGDGRAAREQLEKALNADPENVPALFEMARIHEREGRVIDAVRLFEKAAALEPDVENCGTLANLHARMGRFDEALKWFETGLEHTPDFPTLMHGAARALERMGRLEEATEYLARTLRVAPGYPQAAYDLGGIMMKLGRYAEAVPPLSEAVESDPVAPEPRHMLAVALANAGKGREAAETYARALENAPDFVPSLSGLAWLLATHPDSAIRNGREALRLAERASRLDGGNPNVLNTLAAAYAEAGRFVAAVENAEKAIAVAERSGLGGLAAQIRERLQFYKQGKAFRDLTYDESD